MTDERQHAHQLLENLDGSQLAAVVHLLEVMVTAPRTIQNLPVEDEEITADMAAELDEATLPCIAAKALPTKKYSGTLVWRRRNEETRRLARAFPGADVRDRSRDSDEYSSCN